MKKIRLVCMALALILVFAASATGVSAEEGYSFSLTSDAAGEIYPGDVIDYTLEYTGGAIIAAELWLEYDADFFTFEKLEPGSDAGEYSGYSTSEEAPTLPANVIKLVFVCDDSEEDGVTEASVAVISLKIKAGTAQGASGELRITFAQCAGSDLITHDAEADTASVTVTANPYIESERYDIGEKFIGYVLPGTGLEDFLSELTKHDCELRVADSDDMIVTGGIVCTGMRVQLIRPGGTTVCREYAVVVAGDLTGSGLANINDLVAMRQHLLKTKQLEAGSACFEAANLTKFWGGGDEDVDINDLVALRQHLLKTRPIV